VWVRGKTLLSLGHDWEEALTSPSVSLAQCSHER
jgi:hypothetical protein